MAQKPEVLMKFLRDHQPKTEPVVVNHKKVENSQPVVVKPEVTKNDLDKISDSFNSQVSFIKIHLRLFFNCVKCRIPSFMELSICAIVDKALHFQLTVSFIQILAPKNPGSFGQGRERKHKTDKRKQFPEERSRRRKRDAQR